MSTKLKEKQQIDASWQNGIQNAHTSLRNGVARLGTAVMGVPNLVYQCTAYMLREHHANAIGLLRNPFIPSSCSSKELLRYRVSWSFKPASAPQWMQAGMPISSNKCKNFRIRAPLRLSSLSATCANRVTAASLPEGKLRALPVSTSL